MYLTIALRKEVETVEQAQALTNIVKTKLQDHPEVIITATCTEHLQPNLND